MERHTGDSHFMCALTHIVFLTGFQENLSIHHIMGIPRLKGHLERYSQSGRLGRCIYDCQAPLSSTVVIDGPSLAYHIYSRLVALQPQQAQPSYQELGEAVLNYLCKLEDANVDVYAHRLSLLLSWRFH